MKLSSALVMGAVAALGATSAAVADFHQGQQIVMNGSAGPQFGGTVWGTNQGQGTVVVGGGPTTFFDVFATAFTINVTAILNGPGSLTIIIDFSDFAPADFTNHIFDLLNLKNDGSITDVFASVGTATVTDGGNSIHWEGLGAAIAAAGNQTVVLEITQIVPAPGAAALVGLGGLAAMRRRRMTA